jgi:hypothetical protein
MLVGRVDNRRYFGATLMQHSLRKSTGCCVENATTVRMIELLSHLDVFRLIKNDEQASDNNRSDEVSHALLARTNSRRHKHVRARTKRYAVRAAIAIPAATTNESTNKNRTNGIAGCMAMTVDRRTSSRH